MVVKAGHRKGKCLIESSIVIPVYNRWDMTRQCLKSLAANTDCDRIEVIVVDNCSSDATEKGCQFLGKQLFGDSFTYIRNDVNRNFAGACNQGAEVARGEYIIFLNNDTTVQHGWHAPLINDFRDFPDIAATGPILLYPQETPFGRTVQHLGVYVTPFHTLGHLYRNIPAASPLAKKRRFFQAITGACMAIRKKLFMEAGRFDEGFINGFEDIDLCARLKAMGYRLTVNPDSQVIHHESQSQGRHDNTGHNQRLLREKSIRFLAPDYHLHLENDDLYLRISKWQVMMPAMPGKMLEKLDSGLSSMTTEQIKEAVIAHPYWENGWTKLLERINAKDNRDIFYRPYFALFRDNPEDLLHLVDILDTRENSELFSECLLALRKFDTPPAKTLDAAHLCLELVRKENLPQIAAQYSAYIENYAEFREKDYPALMEKLHQLEAEVDCQA